MVLITIKIQEVHFEFLEISSSAIAHLDLRAFWKGLESPALESDLSS